MALRDWSKIEPQNIRKAAAPLKIEAIKEYFENKGLFFIVNYSESQIKGNMFLTYLSNLDLAYELDLSTASKEEKFELIRIYMETRNLNASDVLKLAVAELLLTYKNVDTTQFFAQSIFTAEEKAEFIQTYKSLIEKWDQFLSSTYIYMIKAIPSLNEELKVETQFKEIADPNFIGLNVAQMFGIPAFIDLYLSIPPHQELVYFKHQFEDYIFNGKNFFHHFCCPENTTFIAFEASTRSSEFRESYLNIAAVEEF